MPPLFPKLPEEDRKAAIAELGPSWREYFFGPFAKVYVLLGFLIVDSSLAVYWVQPIDLYGLLPTLGVAVYLEYLAYQALWYMPAGGLSASSRGSGWHRWVHPVPYGRWTSAYQRARRGLAPGPASGRDGPDPSEFF